MSEDVSLVRISDHLQFSLNYFSQLFKQVTGETFISYTTTQRFERSKELLRDNRLKISEIANQVGYTDGSASC
ncbi:helix-turn-helix domain-containing protein [Neobacillus sp. BF23-41]|uniref:helix-turn-helix domain-containing protein n=1 Tax=Neobacillus sp. BF23-41 TaxID=3240280 RepID=UPI0034E38026